MDWNWLELGGAGDWATWLGVLIALGFGVQQIRASRTDSREATATQTWMEYYLRCIDYPDYACPDFDKLKRHEDNREFYKYEWFVSFMLLACDQVIRLPKGGPNWEQFVRNNVSYHSDYLKSKYFKEGYSPPFSPKLISKVKEVLDEERRKTDR